MRGAKRLFNTVKGDFTYYPTMASGKDARPQRDAHARARPARERRLSIMNAILLPRFGARMKQNQRRQTSMKHFCIRHRHATFT